MKNTDHNKSNGSAFKRPSDVLEQLHDLPVCRVTEVGTSFNTITRKVPRQMNQQYKHDERCAAGDKPVGDGDDGKPTDQQPPQKDGDHDRQPDCS